MKSIIKNVTFVDDTHSKIWANINTELDLVLNKIKALNEVIQPSNLAYISKDTLKARLDKVDKEFKEKMDKTDANIELLNKHIQEELYPPEWWESALSGAEGFTVSLIRNTTFQPLSELAGGLDKDASNNAIKNMDGIESWLREHTFDENAYLWGSKAGEITAGVIGIYEMIQGGILVFAGIAGETSGTLLMATGIGLPVGALVTTTSGGLVAAGGASFGMGIATTGSGFERAGKPIEDRKAVLSDLQEVDSTLDPINEVTSGADGVVNVKLSKSKYPELTKHIEDAIKGGQPDTLTINRGDAKANRKASLKGVDKVPDADLDEYPPAMFSEGGEGASVRPISPSDNRGAGSTIGHQLREYPDGTKIKIEIVE